MLKIDSTNRFIPKDVVCGSACVALALAPRGVRVRRVEVRGTRVGVREARVTLWTLDRLLVLANDVALKIGSLQSFTTSPIARDKTNGIFMPCKRALCAGNYIC